MGMIESNSEDTRPTRRMGWALIVIAVLHNLIGVAVGYRQILEVFQEGVLHAGRPGVFEIVGRGLEEAVQRGGGTAWLFWYFAFGLTLFLLGQCCLWVKTSLPTSFGWQLLALGLGGEILILSSGFWLIILIALCFLTGRYGHQWSAWKAGRSRPR
jgi:hypothetical protein